MKMLIGFLILFAGFSAAAEPCFHSGTYAGKGFGFDASGRAHPYDVVTVIDDASNGNTTYTWANGGTAKMRFKAEGGTLYIDGNSAGTVACGKASQRLIMRIDDFELDEEWLFTGNYLMRNGSKTFRGGKIGYQELLLRQ